MITVPAGIRVLVATKPVDFRKGGDGLAALVREALGEAPFSGTIFVFPVQTSVSVISSPHSMGDRNA
jgi:transposase